jgi:hypothetical protein
MLETCGKVWNKLGDRSTCMLVWSDMRVMGVHLPSVCHGARNALGNKNTVTL